MPALVSCPSSNDDSVPSIINIWSMGPRRTAEAEVLTLGASPNQPRILSPKAKFTFNQFAKPQGYIRVALSAAARTNNCVHVPANH